MNKRYYAIQASELWEDANDRDWVLLVDRPGVYTVGPPRCSRPSCKHKIDHHSRSKGRCFECSCDEVSVPNGQVIPDDQGGEVK